MFSVENARKLLETAGVFFGPEFDEDEDQDEPLAQTLNLNDTFCWACADGEYVSDDELPRLAGLFWHYGWCGILYWVNEKRGQERVEFADVNRFIDFVRHEEVIRQEIPNDSLRAYAKRQYIVGSTD